MRVIDESNFSCSQLDASLIYAFRSYGLAMPSLSVPERSGTKELSLREQHQWIAQFMQAVYGWWFTRRGIQSRLRFLGARLVPRGLIENAPGCSSALPPAPLRTPRTTARMSLRLIHFDGLLGVAFLLHPGNICEPSKQTTNIDGLRWVSFQISVNCGLTHETSIRRQLPDGSDVEYNPCLVIVDTPTSTRPFWTYSWRMPGPLVDAIERAGWKEDAHFSFRQSLFMSSRDYEVHKSVYEALGVVDVPRHIDIQYRSHSVPAVITYAWSDRCRGKWQWILRGRHDWANTSSPLVPVLQKCAGYRAISLSLKNVKIVENNVDFFREVAVHSLTEEDGMPAIGFKANPCSAAFDYRMKDSP
ncbi:hypothetical protein NMY22_g17403 [Coprinellus aureogranulatus]|nr:hypothetical protein NMY22_g17403 [Coprinellus aureogranulatus]